MLVAPMNPHSSTAQSPAFPNTRWSVVLAATERETPGADVALDELCRAYWYPLYAYARLSGQAAHDAQDLTQEFFARLLAHHWLADADREKGKLRTFLIVAFRNFMTIGSAQRAAYASLSASRKGRRISRSVSRITSMISSWRYPIETMPSPQKRRS